MKGRKLSFFQRYIKHISVKKITIFNCCPGSSENDVSAMYNCPVYVCNSDRHKNIDGKIHFFSFPVARHISNKRDEKFGLNFASAKRSSLQLAQGRVGSREGHFGQVQFVDLRIYLRMMVSNRAGERSFSKLKRLKSNLHRTIWDRNG